MIARSPTIAVLALLSLALTGHAQERARRGGGEGRDQARMPTLAFRTDVPAHPYDLMLGRPTGDVITLSVLAYQDLRAVVAYGTQSGKLDRLLPPRDFKSGQPVELVIDGLRAGTRYYYQFRPEPASSAISASGELSFTTAALPGQPFTFVVQADSHLDFGTDPDLYVKSLNNAALARPDFLVDLGDTFMTEKRNAYRDSLPQYLAQRYYLGLVGRTAPVFLVLGNHDGELVQRGADGEAMALWSNATRKKYFPNPEPNAFYTGNTTPHASAGLLQDYYAFAWGDALFVTLDPYWFSPPRNRSGDNWSRTLGRPQYEWLRRTLSASRAKFKFVFIHNLVGGETPENRGGAEASRFFEWGGRDLDGTDSFAKNRPGWEAPIHELLVKHRVSIVFHGHDHLYAQQERDGVIYQLVPQPGHPRYDNTRSAAEYGYKSGVIAGASGILRVTVSPEQTSVAYVRAYPDSAEGGERKTGAITHRYTLNPR